MKAVLVSLVYIVIGGGIGALLAWWFVGWIGLGGVVAAMVAAPIAMLVATAAFVALTSIARALGGGPK